MAHHANVSSNWGASINLAICRFYPLLIIWSYVPNGWTVNQTPHNTCVATAYLPLASRTNVVPFCSRSWSWAAYLENVLARSISAWWWSCALGTWCTRTAILTAIANWPPNSASPPWRFASWERLEGCRIVWIGSFWALWVTGWGCPWEYTEWSLWVHFSLNSLPLFVELRISNYWTVMAPLALPTDLLDFTLVTVYGDVLHSGTNAALKD